MRDAHSLRFRQKKIHWFGLECNPNFCNRPLWIAITIQQVITGDSHFVNQPLEEIFAKTRWMSRRQANVFVQMKNLNTAPVDAGRADQSIQEFKLRCPSSGYKTGASLVAQRLPERARSMIGCCPAQRVLLWKNFYFRLQHGIRLAS